MKRNIFGMIAELMAVLLFIGLFFPHGTGAAKGSDPSDQSKKSEAVPEGAAATEPKHLKPLSEGSDYYYADNELLIQTKKGIRESAVLEIAKRSCASVVGSIPEAGIYQLRLSDACDYEELRKRSESLQSDASVENAVLNCVEPLCSDDEESDWAGGDRGWGFREIGADRQEQYLPSMRDRVDIAIVDSGFQDHYDLSYTFTNPSEKQRSSAYEHGTHVAGILGASWNGKGIKGVFPNPTGDSKITGQTWRGRTIAQETDFLVQTIKGGTKVINQSYGYTDSVAFMNYWITRRGAAGIAVTEEQSRAWSKKAREVMISDDNAGLTASALRRLIDEGYEFLIIQSAGNCSRRGNGDTYVIEYKDKEYLFEDTTEMDDTFLDQIRHIIDNQLKKQNIVHGGSQYFDGVIPSIYSNRFAAIRDKSVADRILVVGSYDSKDRIAKTCCMDERVDLMAPGVKVYSTVNGEIQAMSGTSMAAPQVAGAAASIWSMDADLTAEEVKALLLFRDPGKHSNAFWSSKDRTPGLAIDHSRIKFITDSEWTNISKPTLNLAFSLELAEQYLGLKSREAVPEQEPVPEAVPKAVPEAVPEEKKEIDHVGILEELRGQYGVMPIGEEQIRVREGGSSYRPLLDKQFDGLLFADFYDYDLDGNEELLVMRNQTSVPLTYANLMTASQLTKEEITLEMFVYKNGAWQSASRYVIKESNISYAGTNRRITFFRYSLKGMPAIGVDLYHEFNSMNETILSLSFYAGRFSVNGAVNYGEYPGSDEEHIVVSIPVKENEIGGAPDRDGDGLHYWRKEDASQGEAVDGALKETYERRLSELGLTRVRYRSLYQYGSDEVCRLDTEDILRPVSGNLTKLGVLYSDLVYDGEEIQKIDRVDVSGSLDAYR